MIEQGSHSPDDCQSHSHSPVAVTRRIVQLIEFLEDRFLIGFPNANAGIRDRNAQHRIPNETVDHYAAGVRIADGVAEQVLQYQPQQVIVAADILVAFIDPEWQIFHRRLLRVLLSEFVKQ